MVTAVLEWLLGLDEIHLARDAPLLFRWGRPVPAWILFCAGLAALAWVCVVYRQERASLLRRGALASIRLCVVALLGCLLCEPLLVLQRNRTERSFVALAVDVSQSMAQRDSYEDQELGEAVARGAVLSGTAELQAHSRLGLVQRALLADEGAALKALLERNIVQLAAFSGGVELVTWASGPGDAPELVASLERLTADGRRTDLAGAIEELLDKGQGRRLAAIVLASDGQSTGPGELKEALGMARGRQIPIYPLRIGSSRAGVDVEVGSLRVADRVFVSDYLQVEARVSTRGVSESTELVVRLVDERSGREVASQTITLDPEVAEQVVSLQVKAEQAGKMRLRVEVPTLPNETAEDNNSEVVEVVVVDDRLRVLYVEGYPRYEYRYLKNALLREKSIELSSLLLEADADFVQEGTDPVRRFPQSPEELNRFDVVILGDVDPHGGWATAEQLTMLLDYVANRGGGLAFLAGERFVPHRLAGTPLAKLLPVRIDESFLGRYEQPLLEGYRWTLTPEGRRHRLFASLPEQAARQTADGAEVSERPGGFDELPELYWIARTSGPKPGASVLAEHPTARTRGEIVHDGGLLPLLVIAQYGAGMTLFQATDDTWRWRRKTGEFLHDTYWVQMVRALALGNRGGRSGRWTLRTDRRLYEYGETVSVQLDVLDPEWLAQLPEAMPFPILESPAGAAPTSDAMLAGNVVLQRIGPAASTFEGTWVAPRAGFFDVQTSSAWLRPGEAAISASFRVRPPDLEFRAPQADHEALNRVAELTSGAVIELDRLVEGLAGIRDQSVRIPDDVVEPLWDSRLAMICFAMLLTCEWALRKAFGLL